MAKLGVEFGLEGEGKMWGPCHWHHSSGPGYVTHQHWRHQHYRDEDGAWHERPCGPKIRFVLWIIPYWISF